MPPALVSGLLSYLEPDPDIVWDRAGIESALEQSDVLVEHARAQRDENQHRP
ncbi:hypothetical protein [Microbacterium sp. zg-YB36]|uniref:hypothetical protein n=1 Tax=Microbacterium sp. zg-YB36 TaxID=2969407 RepID=UPI00214CAA06|nr:hypothetical protein [Microbacterium sp. zg-YB36]MDL5350912.1 hypothetical protein [Microbacterium sp. zg-YB36]